MSEIKCSGLSIPHENFSMEAKGYITSTYKRVQRELIKKYGVTNDREMLEFEGIKMTPERIIWAIESACTEETFNQNREEWVKAGVMFNAGSEYWYRYEKEW